MDSPPPESSQLWFNSTLTRRRIISSYWVIILLAVPIWWKTTSIERLSLPTPRVAAQDGKELIFPIQVQIGSSYIPEQNGALAGEVQKLLNSRSEMQQLNGILVSTTAEQKPSGYQVTLNDAGENGHELQGRQLLFRPSGDQVAPELAEVLMGLLAPFTQSWHSQHQSQRVMRYSPRYRLAFTLLNEDSSSGVFSRGWDVQSSISKQIAPVLNRLSVLHNFTIESQVQFHAPLAFNTTLLEMNGAHQHGLSQEDLTVFVNSAEWTLSSSVSNDPVLHFVLFIPSASNTPLRILNFDGSPSPSNAFILPQWGGIVLLNLPSSGAQSTRLTTHDLDPAFSTFRYQLMTLLGVPPLPNSVLSSSAELVTNWQLDALLRRRALENVENAKSTLKSITKLVQEIEGMPVGPDVQGDVEEALQSLEQAYSTAQSSVTHVLHYSRDASTLASRAFFNPGMLALLYFPAEHKYAVYAPLFATIGAPLVMAVIREVISWRKERRAGQGRRGRNE